MRVVTFASFVLIRISHIMALVLVLKSFFLFLIESLIIVLFHELLSDYMKFRISHNSQNWNKELDSHIPQRHLAYLND